MNDALAVELVEAIAASPVAQSVCASSSAETNGSVRGYVGAGVHAQDARGRARPVRAVDRAAIARGELEAVKRGAVG